MRTCRITFCDGEQLYVTDEKFILNGWVATEDERNEYYCKMVYETVGEHYEFETFNPIVGIAGFIGKVDYFSVGRDTENCKIYKSTSVKSIDNLNLDKKLKTLPKSKFGI
jgi:hypothetical protein